MVRFGKLNWLKTCQGIGGKVAKEILKIYRTERQAQQLGTRGFGGDLTLLADKAAEDIIINRLGKLGVPLLLISEEVGEIRLGKEGTPEYIVVVDPLDGSFNFQSGIDYFALSIAVLNAKTFEMEVGYVRNILANDEYYATKDKTGAFKNGKKIATSKRREPRNILLECSMMAAPINLSFLSWMFRKARHSRGLGAVALDFCLVAEGKFDCLLYAGSSRFLDVAAGAYIAEKAGGVVTDFSGNKKVFKGTDLVAKNLLVSGNSSIKGSILKR